MEPLSEEDQKLIAWFKGRELPTDRFQIAPWLSTDNLTNMVELASENIRRGNATARANLKLVKAKLEAQQS